MPNETQSGMIHLKNRLPLRFLQYSTTKYAQYPNIDDESAATKLVKGMKRYPMAAVEFIALDIAQALQTNAQTKPSPPQTSAKNSGFRLIGECLSKAW